MLRVLISSALLLLAPPTLQDLALRCDAVLRVDPSGQWESDRLSETQAYTLLKDLGDNATLSRCSFAASVGQVTCDEYVVDRIEVDSLVGHRKYYVFTSQYDLQVIDGRFSVENNGRETVTFGECRAIAG